jgi:hypothetical protein
MTKTLCAVLIPAALLAVTACQQDPSPEAPAKTATNILLPSEPDQAEQGYERIGRFELRFDPARLTKVGASIALPPNWTSTVLGIKLLAPERAAMLEKADCAYGASGSVVRCNADQEAGLAFVSVTLPYQEFTSSLPADQVKPLRLAGEQGVSWTIGAEGEGAEYIVLPGGERQSLLIVRQHRETGNPDPAAISSALNSLRLSAAQQLTP